MPVTLPLVFVSYAEEDSPLARAVAESLKSAGFATWLYQENSLPGVSYLTQIHAAMSRSDAVAVLLSLSSLRSHQVDREVDFGHDLGKPLLPLLVDLSHEEVGRRKPEYQIIFGHAVSIRVPQAPPPDVIAKVIDGLRELVETARQIVPPPDRDPPPATPVPEAGAPSPEWAAVARRLEAFHPEISRLRGWLDRRWKQACAAASEDPSDGTGAGARVRVADDLCRDLVDVVSQEWAPAPRDFVLVARGGYGRGVLSVGSDIDLTLFHPAAQKAEAEAFWRRYTRDCVDCWSGVRGIRVSPIILSEEDCRPGWIKKIDEADLAPFVSFAFSRPIAGSHARHESLRALWQDAVAGLSPGAQATIVRVLRDRISGGAVDPRFRRFDTKTEAGGILEYRLTGFLEQVIDILGGGSESPGWSVPSAHHFLLRLREVTFGSNRTHILTETNLPAVAARMFPQEAEADRVPVLLEEIARHRRRIRAGFNAALDRADELLNRHAI